MILEAYNQRLLAQLTTVGSGLSAYVSWATIDGTTSQVVSTGNIMSSVVGDVDTHVVLDVDPGDSAVDPNRMRKVTTIMVRNNTASPRALQFYIEREGVAWNGTYLITPAFNIPVGGMLSYAPETGWRVYDADGQYGIAGPAGATGATGADGPAGTPADVTTVEVNVAAQPVETGTFTITDAAITPSTTMTVWQAIGPYTGKGTLADEAEMESVQCVAYPASGSATVRWWSADGSALRLTPTPMAWQRGAILGNVKFNYQILS